MSVLTAEPESVPESPPGASRAGGAAHRSVLNGAVWLVGGYAGLQMFRFAANLVLARLVAPDVFGIMAIVNLMIQGVHMVSDVGIGTWIVQHPRGEEPRLLHTAWTVAAVRGVAIWVATGAVAVPAAWVYGEPQLLLLIPVAGFTSVVSGFNSVAMFTQARKLAQGRLMLIELGTYGVSTVVSVAWVWAHPTPWALVAGSLISSALTLWLSHTALPRASHRFAWDRDVVSGLMGYGRWIFLGTLLTYLTNQADRMIVGAVVSVTALGLYHVAAMFAGVPGYLASGLAGNWVLPLFGRHRDDPASVPLLTRYYTLVVRFAWLLTAGMLATAPATVELLYPEPYRAGADLTRVLAWGVWFQILQGVHAAALMAHGRPRAAAAANGVKLAALVPFAAGGAYLGGLTGMVVGFALADAARYLVTLALFRRTGISTAAIDLLLTLLLAAVAAAEWAAEAEFGADRGAAVRRLVLGGLAVSVVGGGLVFSAWRGVSGRRAG